MKGGRNLTIKCITHAPKSKLQWFPQPYQQMSVHWPRSIQFGSDEYLVFRLRATSAITSWPAGGTCRCCQPALTIREKSILNHLWLGITYQIYDA